MRVRVVGVKQYQDRHGTWRRYYRRKGAPSVSISMDLSGAALAAEVARLDALYLTPKAKAGTLRGLVIDYRSKSNHWRSLRARTRKDYERVFAWLGDPALDLPLVNISSQSISRARDKARDQHEPKFANLVVTVLKMVFRHGVGEGLVRENPAVGLEKAIRDAEDVGDRPARGNRPCEPWEAVAVLDHAPAKLRPAIATALYACLREGDVVALSKTARKGEWLTTVQSKSRRAGKPGRPVTVYVGADYAAILDAIQPNNAVTVCVKDNGEPWTLEGFKTAWTRYRDDLVERGLINPGVTFHGLRHTAPTILEDNGFDEAQTKHILGHGPKTVSGHYGMTAERKVLLRDMALTVQHVIREARAKSTVRRLDTPVISH